MGDDERPALGMEFDAAAGEAALGKEDEGGSECGVAAKIDFDSGSEPAQAEMFFLGKYEGGFGEVVFGGDALHQFIRKPFLFQKADPGGVAAEKFAGEGVHLEVTELSHVAIYAGGTEMTKTK